MDKSDNRAREGDTGQTSIKILYGEDPRDAREIASEANEALIRDTERSPSSTRKPG